jgi:ankyrin repeat protein
LIASGGKEADLAVIRQEPRAGDSPHQQGIGQQDKEGSPLREETGVQETKPSQSAAEVLSQQQAQSKEVSNKAEEASRSPKEEVRSQVVPSGVLWNEATFLESVRNGDLRMVELFLTAEMTLHARDESGGTALMAAAMNGHDTIVRILLDRGADVNARDESGGTALMAAAMNGHDTIVRILLDRGADVNARDREGWSALMYATWNGYPTTVQALLDRNADANAKNNDEETAFAMVPQGKSEIIHLLKKAGARK